MRAIIASNSILSTPTLRGCLEHPLARFVLGLFTVGFNVDDADRFGVCKPSTFPLFIQPASFDCVADAFGETESKSTDENHNEHDE